MKMRKNIGKQDRIIRLLIALLAGVCILFTSNTYLKIVLAGLSLFSLFEAVFSWCAFYQLIGRNTCPIDSRG